MKVTVLRLWALWVVPTMLILVTYSRLPPERLYRVSDSGIGGGVGRALVYVAFPGSLAAIALVGVTSGSFVRRWQRVAGLAAILLCATVMTGMVDPDDLDFKLINLLPVAGVVLAFVVSASTHWPGVSCGRATAAVAVTLGILSLPWIAAYAGFSLPGRLFLTKQLVAEAGEPGLVPAVHLGDHHGLSSALLVVTVIAVWRAPRGMPRTSARRALQGYLALLVSYGLVNMAQDFWGEQVATRGWTNWMIPDALEPGVSVVWAVIVAGAIVAYLLPRPARISSTVLAEPGLVDRS
ncbi:MAG: hypothetical protein F2681_05365 [Actinobacteria bacterium]|uniref:Unannotated protein n=1 Tax=freshwater metagenome TaxID=449393 RepID=A0A6J6A6M5_9ZZZZ|nr:hypothetical protein [Actinomycetota bacterium]MSW77523.1 hypothetical protein [Actinomycetota bacterium]MSX92456.1 hypothetical protein [Actinomycetota bacterium]MSZ82553.1 hypothetical protein [Actinomycetota bacterium]MTB17767.1 hypothetical protein [Actinomycetota bacterium]